MRAETRPYSPLRITTTKYGAGRLRPAAIASEIEYVVPVLSRYDF